jgi:outer membrane protein OmpA-like peptidoglycan-associated protein
VSDYNESGGSKNQNRDIYTIGYTTEPPPENMFIVKGKITAEGSMENVEANIICNVRGAQDAEFDVSNRFSGRYKLMLDESKNYAVEVISKGYMPYRRQLSLRDTTDIGNVIEMDIALRPLNIGQQFELNDVFFVQSKSEIRPESIPALNNLTLILKNNPEMVIQLGGHTDNIGGRKANLELSRLRAEQVKAYLLGQGIAANRIKTVGFGSRFPKFTGSGPEVRSQNRRVEVKILKI